MIKQNTVGSHVERFLNTKPNEETRAWYVKHLVWMVKHLGEETPLVAITRFEAEECWQAIRKNRICWDGHPYKPAEKRELSTNTMFNRLRAIKSFWRAMVKQGYASINPFDHLNVPKDSRPAEMRAADPEVLRDIWKAAMQSSVRDFAIVTILMTSGMRAGELVSMRLDQLNVKKGIAWVEGKRGWRKVFLGKASVEAIRDYMLHRPRIKGVKELWLNKRYEGLTVDGLHQLIKRLAKRAGVTDRHNLHAFRHRAAQAWLDSGVNAGIVSRALGHADVAFTMQFYGNQDDLRVAQAIRSVELAPFQEYGNFDDSKIASMGIVELRQALLGKTV